MSFIAALRQYFGFKEGGYKGKTGLSSFSEEYKELTPQDREELAPLLSAELGTLVEVPQNVLATTPPTP